MAVAVDTSRPLRGLDGRRDLVRAIVSAHPGDESDWLEWKSDLDLATKKDCFHIAKAILGMANRPVEVAARTCGGFGYLAVGVEPENLAGIAIPDPSQWTGLVEAYLKGDTGPAWEWTIVPTDDRDILVVTVDAPQNGDPPWPLRKEYSPSRSGTIFVRKSGKTEPAVAEDIDALTRRAQAGGEALPQLTVEIAGDVPLPWIVGAVLEENVSAWIDGEYGRHLAAARAVEAERNRPEYPLTALEKRQLGVAGVVGAAHQERLRRIAADIQRGVAPGAIAGLQAEADRRTLEEYTDELDKWATEAMKPALLDLPRRYFEAGHGLVYLRVTNDSTQYLPGVQVRVHIEFDGAKGFAEIPEGTELPNPPRSFGEPKPARWGLDSLNYPLPAIDPLADLYPTYVRDTTVEDGSIRITFDAGDLRPTADYDGDDFYILIPVRPADGLLHATWTATVKHRNGVIHGELAIPVREDPVDLGAVLDGDPSATARDDSSHDDR